MDIFCRILHSAAHKAAVALVEKPAEIALRGLDYIHGPLDARLDYRPVCKLPGIFDPGYAACPRKAFATFPISVSAASTGRDLACNRSLPATLNCLVRPKRFSASRAKLLLVAVDSSTIAAFCCVRLKGFEKPIELYAI